MHVVEYYVELTLVPERYVSIPGGRASFTCITLTDETLHWLVNGSLLQNLSLSNVSIITHDRGVRELEFVNLPAEYNATIITCTVTIPASQTNARDSQLFLQGL
jgi:hypothetical protein